MKTEITRENLQNKLESAVGSLLQMAEDLCWNKISPNCLFILSEIENSDKDFATIRLTRKLANDKKKPKPIDNLMTEMLEIYSNLYDINLFVYKATKKLTIIEVAYFAKSNLDTDYMEKVLDRSPMLHAKVAIPGYANQLLDKKGREKKFNVNWEHNTLDHRWNMCCCRLKFRLEYARKFR